MTLMDSLTNLTQEVAALWSGDDASILTAEETIRANELLGRIRRTADCAQAKIASEIARQSRPELGPEGLAKQQGFRNPTALIAATVGTTAGEAAKMVRVGEAIAPRMQLNGDKAPARHPHVAAALDSASIGTPAASAIITMLDGVALRAGRDALDAAEKTLAEQAAGLTLDQLGRVLLRAQAWLDPDGIEPREAEMRAKRDLIVRENRDGSIHIEGDFDPERGAPIKAAIEAFVTAELHAVNNAVATGGAEGVAAGAGAAAGAAGGAQPGAAGADPDSRRRSIGQIRADALVRICEHIIGCSNKDVPLEGATVIVRMNLDDLMNDTGFATIDGLAAPVSISTARRMAAGGKVISCVFDTRGQIMDWGRARRVFTKSQRLALAERDGGCAMCGCPPGQSKVHHVRWWAKDAGPTDLANGIVLCDCCHHRIHDNGWQIRIDGHGVKAKVWFIPPPHVDPDRTPRLGGRRRFDFAA